MIHYHIILFPPPWISFGAPNPPLILHSNYILYHCCHRSPGKTNKLQNNKSSNLTVPAKTLTDDEHVHVSNNDLCDCYEKRCFVPVQCFRLSVVFMFMPVFML